MTALIGPTTAGPAKSVAQVAILVSTETRGRLSALLGEPYMEGVRASEFIDRAVARAREEAALVEAAEELGLDVDALREAGL